MNEYANWKRNWAACVGDGPTLTIPRRERELRGPFDMTQEEESPDESQKFLGLGAGAGRTDGAASAGGGGAAVAALRRGNVEPVMPPRADDLRLRAPRISPPSSLAAICATDDHDRAVHTYGRSFRDRIRAYNLQFLNPPDVVARIPLRKKK